MQILALPSELTKELAPYPNLLDALAEVFNKPALPSDYTPETIEICFDELPVYCWANGREVMNLKLPEDTQPRLIEWAFDGELVYVTLDGQPILSRLQNVATLQQLRSNYVTR